MKRTALMRRTPLRRRSTKPSARKRKAEQEGPQWRLCHETECVACYHARWVRKWGREVEVSWTDLGAGNGCHGHHEPPRSLGGKDEDCLPMCHTHHEQRHRMGFTAFWIGIDVEGARAEMRLRAKLKITCTAAADGLIVAGIETSLAPSGAEDGEQLRADTALPVASAEPGPDGEDDGPARASIEESTP